jgi:hypothetical protein
MLVGSDHITRLLWPGGRGWNKKFWWLKSEENSTSCLNEGPVTNRNYIIRNASGGKDLVGSGEKSIFLASNINYIYFDFVFLLYILGT